MKPDNKITSLYYLKNRKKLIDYQRKYYRENTESCKATSRRIAYLNAGKLREYHREYKQKDKEKWRKYYREYMREYRKKNEIK